MDGQTDATDYFTVSANVVGNNTLFSFEKQIGQKSTELLTMLMLYLRPGGVMAKALD